ncbi:glycosyltransferase family 4 protein [Azospirillum doebereinerae]
MPPSSFPTAGGTNAPARLLLVNYEFPPLGGGGGAVTANLARELAAMGWSVRVLTSAYAGLPRRETIDGYEVLRVPTVRRRHDRCSIAEMVLAMAGSLVAAPLVARRWRPDLTIAFFGLPGGPAGWLVERLYGTPYLVSLLGGDVPGFAYRGIGLYHRLSGGVIRALWRGARGVVANSDGLADLARRHAPGLPVAVVPNGVDPVAFTPAPGPRPDGPLSNGPVRLLLVGRLVHQKAVDVMLAALAGLDGPARPLLTVVGDGPERSALEEQARRLGLEGCVTFAGWVARDRLADTYRAHDVLVSPSRFEGMSLVLQEAMACGLPVVATRIPGSEELIVDGVTGLLVAPEDAAGLAAAVARFTADPTLIRSWGLAGRRWVETRYTWRAAAEAYLALGGLLVAPAPSPAPVPA